MEDNPFYGPTAYRADAIPMQGRQTSESGRGWFNRKFDMRLPWGNAEDVVPQSLRKPYSPDKLRRTESKKSPFEGIEFHGKINHEIYRHAGVAFRTNFFNLLYILGKNSFLLMFPLFFITAFLCFWVLPPELSLEQYAFELLASVPYFFGVPLAVWALGALPFQIFPKWAIKPSSGPKWELNRRTGLVTVYRNGKNNASQVDWAPFYEFDAYLTNEIISPGQVVHALYLSHRYRPILLPLGSLIGKVRGEECFALWDMFQNFMDTSRPIPDTPLWEEHRPNDPVTAEHDRRTGRPPRYWRDMDDDTWKQKEIEMMSKVFNTTMLQRRNVMRSYVQYDR